MTAPISSTPHHVTAIATAQAPASAKSASNFEGLLEETLSPQQKQALTFGFGDLGMFGRYGAITPKTQAAIPVEDQEVREPRRTNINDISVVRALQDGGVGAPTPDVAGTTAGLLNSNMTGRAPENSSASFQDDTPAGDALQDADQPLAAIETDELQSPHEFGAGFRASYALPEGDRAENLTNLVVTGANGTVSIVARGVVADPAGMRRMMAQVAEEYGVAVSDIRLNGDAGTEFTIQGVQHGRLAR